jgi:hypothetical protein
MSIPTRIIIFGICSGLAWSLAPGIYGGLFFDPHSPLALILVTCATIGVFVSAMLAWPLLKANHWVITLLLGILALPIGAFCFGFFDCLFESSQDNPFRIGLMYAFWSTLWPYFAVVLVPSAVLTTFLLWKCLLMSK